MPEQEQTAMKYKSLEDMEEAAKKCVICDLPCEMRCGRCVKVGYCSLEHQRAHWNAHRDDCFPAIRIEDPNSHTDSYLLATRNINAGDLIIKEGVLMIAPAAQLCQDSYICLGCCTVLPGRNFGRTVLSNCENCSWPLCSKKCERVSWHTNNECKILSERSVDQSSYRDAIIPFVYDAIKVLRLLLLREKNPEKFQSFLQLEIPGKMRTTTMELDFVYEFITGACQMKEYSEEFISRVLNIALLNSVGAPNTSTPVDINLSCETFIYEHGGNQTHSCIANTVNIEGDEHWGDHTIVAVTPIQRGEVLTECYEFSKIYWKGTVERRQQLREDLHTWCHCSRCSDPTELGTFVSGIKCKKVKGGEPCQGFYLPKNPLDERVESIWMCNSDKCKATRKYSDLSKIIHSIEKSISDARTLDQKLKILKKHSNISVHENHYTLMKLRYAILPTFGQKFVKSSKEETAVQMKDLASKCLEIADKLAPGRSIHRGVLLFYVAFAMDFHHFLLVEEGTDTYEKATARVAEIIKIRDEAKKILGLLPKGCEGNRFYNNLLLQDCKLAYGFEGAFQQNQPNAEGKN